MNRLCISFGRFNVEALRQTCLDVADCKQGPIYDSQSHKTWHQAIEEDAVGGKYATKNGQKQAYFHHYIVNNVLTAG